MPRTEALGEPPRVRVEIVDELAPTDRSVEPFLRLRRFSLRNHYADGSKSAAYRYDLVERDALDAVAMLLISADGRVALRSALRPPLAFRGGYSTPHDEGDINPVAWEIPAGLIESDERGDEGVRACAARETMEEVGLSVAPPAFAMLGPPVMLSPGVLAEKLFFVVADVDPAQRVAPTEDGTAVEERAEVWFVALEEALAACRDGRIADIKTELGLRRLAERR